MLTGLKPDSKSLMVTVCHKENNYGIFETYYNTGTIQSRLTYAKNKKDGLEELFHRNSQLKECTEFQNGKKNGEYIYL